MKVKKITRIAILSSLALIIFVLESLIPPVVPVAGVKIGLANTVVLFTMATSGVVPALFVMLVKVFLGNLFTGTAVSLIYSLLGSGLCFCAQWLAIAMLGSEKMWAVSVIGAIFHNIGQVMAAAVLTGTDKIIWYVVILIPVGIITGAFTGIAATYTLKATKKLDLKE